MSKKTQKHIIALLVCTVLLTTMLFSECMTFRAAAAEEKTTLMVYMIGSDLESGSASATADLEEMRESGVDFDRVNILVCTGGSKKWHSDEISADQIGRYHLTKDALEQLGENDSVSMGEADTLSNFLTDCYTEYPAEHYGLILWDHGNGPLIGYGMDKLYDNDSLTLAEIGEALAASPFDAKNKLDFIGFDACLMSSAELVCTVDDYADYLIASQEVEPSFGWNYAFLSECGKTGTKEFVSAIIDHYISYSEDYFADKKFFSSDVTLAAMDLSYGKELETALNTLFAKASKDVSGDYPKLAAERIQSKGLGRATTGSEYDLVDLTDLMGYMSERYAKEAGSVSDILGKMVVKNGTNAENCSGLSIYYPYYNKKYYQKSWKETYQELGLFPDYLTYLSRYDQIWLGTDMQEYFEGALVPAEKAKGEYTLQLTEEQQEHFASAKYYLLRRTGDELFQPVFISSDVENKKGILKANYNGEVIYFCQNEETKCIPCLTETDSTDGMTYYDIVAYFYDSLWDSSDHTADDVDEPAEDSDGQADSSDHTEDPFDEIQDTFDDLLDAFEDVQYSLTDMFRGNARIQIALDHESGEVAVKSIQEWDPDDPAELKSGKQKDILPEDWKRIVFPNIPSRFLTRDDKGMIQPFAEWPRGDAYDGFEFVTADGFSFLSKPIYRDGFEYFLMFEITDVQNNVYSSELLPVTLEKVPEKKKSSMEEITMGADGRCLLYEDENVSVDLQMIRSFTDGSYSYLVSLENRNDYPVELTLWLDEINEEHSPNAGTSIYGKPGETVQQSFSGIYSRCRLLGMEIPETLTFSLDLKNAETEQTVFSDVGVLLTFDQDAAFHTVWQPFFGMEAENQLLYDKNGLRIELIHAGYTPSYAESSYIDHDYRTLTFALMAENTGKDEVYIAFDEVRLNGESVSSYVYEFLNPGMKLPVIIEMTADDIRFVGVENISSAEIMLSIDGADAESLSIELENT